MLPQRCSVRERGTSKVRFDMQPNRTIGMRRCAHCGVEFAVTTKHPNVKHCSHLCGNQAVRHAPIRPVEERFWEKVQKTDGCWLWTGATIAAGYGELAVGQPRKPLRAHRLSWEMHHGPIPEGLLVLHHCDVRNCVRPEHLFLGTHQDNMADAYAKGRMRPWGWPRGGG